MQWELRLVTDLGDQRFGSALAFGGQAATWSQKGFSANSVIDVQASF